MSDDIELLRLRAKAKAKLEAEQEEWKPEKNYAPTLSEMEEAKADANTKYVQEIKRMGIKPSAEPDETEVGIPFTDASIDVPTQAMASGWVGGIPFLKDAVSAYDGIAETIEEGGSFEDGYARYEDKLNNVNKDLNTVEHHSPWTMAAGEIAGTTATMLAGGAALKAAGAGATLTAKGIGAVSAVGTGALSQLSRSEDRGPEDLAIGAGLGVAGEVGAHYVGKGVKKVGSYVMDKADDIYAAATRKILGMDNVTSSKAFKNMLEQHNIKESHFFENVLTARMKDSDELVIDIAKDAPDRMLDKLTLHRKALGKELGQMYKSVDTKVDVVKAKRRLIAEVTDPLYASKDTKYHAIADEVRKYIESLGKRPSGVKKEITPEGTKIIEDMRFDTEWSLTDLHGLQKDIRNRVKNIFKKAVVSAKEADEYDRQVATGIGNIMDDVLEGASTENDNLLGKVIEKRREFGSMKYLENTLEAKSHRKFDDPMSALKEAISFKSLLAGGIAAKYVGAPGLLVGPAFSRMINDPNTPVYLSKGMESIAKTIQEVPGGRIAARVNSAALQNNDYFEKTLYGLVAEQNLKANRIPRNTQSIRDYSEDIRHYLKAEDREMLRSFDIALESENPDALGAFLDGVSKAPGANQFFEEGVGFDGKVFTEDDKMALERQLKMTDMPATQRMEMMENLRSNGIIPDFNTIVQPQPQKHQPRTKKLKDY